MSENKSRFNPWVPTIILGVITIMFSFYALQSQTDALDAGKKIEALEKEVSTWKRAASEQEKIAEQALMEAERVRSDCETARLEAEKKLNKRK